MMAMVMRAFSIVFAVALLLVASRLAAGREHLDYVPLQIPDVMLYDTPGLEMEMLDELNAERARHGLAPLRADPQLASIARAYAREMLRRHFFGHVTPDGTTIAQRLQLAAYHYKHAGENLAYGTGVEGDVGAAVTHLMESAGHRANILERNFTRVGIGAVAVSTYATIYVQEFAGD